LVNVEFTKIRRGPFTGEIIVAKEVYQYRYPYYLPESIVFLPTYNDDSRNFLVNIKLLFIESYSSSAVEKQIQIKTFLSQFRRSNQKKAQIKQLIQDSFQQALVNKIIQDHCQMEFKNEERKSQCIRIEKLNNLIIVQTDVVNFYKLVL